MKTRIIQKTLLGSAIALAVGTVYAQQSPSAEDLLQQYDRDSNQTLSNAEFQTLYRAEVSNQSSKQADGRTDNQSRSANSDRSRANQNQQADSGQEDWQSQAQQAFLQADIDEDEELAAAELEAVMPLATFQNNRSEVASTRSQSDSNRWQRNGNDQSAAAQDSRSNPRTDQRNMPNAQADASGSLEMKVRQEPMEIQGREITNSQDEELGEIERVVRHTTSGDLYVVINKSESADGETRSVIQLDELEEQEESLLYTGSQQQLQAYEESQYEEFTAETAQRETQERSQPQVAATPNNPQ